MAWMRGREFSYISILRGSNTRRRRRRRRR